MKIELKKLKVFESGSEETYCFTADIWIDGRYQGSVRNDGRGGSHIISPPSIEAQMDAWGKTLPRYDLGIPSHEDPSKPMMVEQDAESLINDIVEKHLQSKDLKKLMSKHIVFTRRGERGVFQVRPIAKPSDVLSRTANIETMREKHNADFILNLIPFEDALQIYLEQGK